MEFMQKQTDYGEAIRTKYPEQVVIAIARDRNGVPNPITLGWSMITSGDPPMMAVSIGKTRYSLEVIRGAGEFVITFPSEEMAEPALFFGTRSGRETRKLETSGIKTHPAQAIDCVLLADAVANFECVLCSETETGDHVLFVGKVVASHVNEKTKKRLYTRGPGYQMGGVA